MKLEGDSTVTAPLFGVVPLFAAADLSADLGVCLVGDVTNAFTVARGTDGGGAAAAFDSSSDDTYLTMLSLCKPESYPDVLHASSSTGTTSNANAQAQKNIIWRTAEAEDIYVWPTRRKRRGKIQTKPYNTVTCETVQYSTDISKHTIVYPRYDAHDDDDDAHDDATLTTAFERSQHNTRQHTLSSHAPSDRTVNTE